MSTVIKIVLVVILVLVVVGAALRARKVHRDEVHERRARRDRGLLAPPPSPYAASKGFRLIDAEGNPSESARPEPPRPRLEPDREYVFGEAPSSSFEEISPPSTRHNERWALERSLHRSTMPMRPRITVVVVIAILLVLVVATYTMKGRHHPPSPTTTSSVAVGVSGKRVITGAFVAAPAAASGGRVTIAGALTP